MFRHRRAPKVVQLKMLKSVAAFSTFLPPLGSSTTGGKSVSKQSWSRNNNDRRNVLQRSVMTPNIGLFAQYQQCMPYSSETKTDSKSKLEIEQELVRREWLMENQVCRLILNNPKQRNAMSLKMLNELKESLREVSEKEHTRVIVLAAEPPVFSSGHNLKELTTNDGLTYHAKVFAACSELMKLVQNMHVPVVCSVQGMAAAAGCQLVATCDIVIAGESSQFSTPGAKAGLFCSTPGVALARAVPRKVAMDMLLTGRAISSAEALRAGLVSRVVPDSEVEAETLKVAEDICKLSKPVIGLGKGFFYAQIENDRNTAYRLGERVMVENLRLNDCQEGISGFLEKRKPHWSHKNSKAH